MRLVRSLVFAGALAVGSSPEAAGAQDLAPLRVERASWTNPRDGTGLDGGLALPSGPGPHRGVVLLSVAGTDPLVRRLVAKGYAVLTPTLRGFVSVEPLLQATFEDLAGDVGAAVTYLRMRPDVDGNALAVVAQSDNAPFAIRFAEGSEVPVPLVLLAPPVFPGVETFRIEQRGIAEGQGYDAEALRALDGYVAEIADVVLGERSAYAREYRLQSLRARSPVELPRNAAFPADEAQMRFFASPLWHDRIAFEPEVALARLSAPVLLLIGASDPNTPMDAYLAAARRGLGAAPSADATVCRLPGRTRHTFSPVTVDAIAEWLEARLGGPDVGVAGLPAACLPDETP